MYKHPGPFRETLQRIKNAESLRFISDYYIVIENTASSVVMDIGDRHSLRSFLGGQVNRSHKKLLVYCKSIKGDRLDFKIMTLVLIITI